MDVHHRRGANCQRTHAARTVGGSVFRGRRAEEVARAPIPQLHACITWPSPAFISASNPRTTSTELWQGDIDEALASDLLGLLDFLTGSQGGQRRCAHEGCLSSCSSLPSWEQAKIGLALAAGLVRSISSCCHVHAANMFDEMSLKMKQQLHTELLQVHV
ncbi:unnamed protein product [Urochloa humidicola]